MRRTWALALAVLLAACSGPSAAEPSPTATAAPEARSAAAGTTQTPVPTPLPTPALPPFYIESLRANPHPGGQIQVQEEMFRGPLFTKYHVAWPSQGEVMTGTISIPDGDGPFPVVIVNHGHIPVDRYWVGQDSGIFGDPMASHGFISIAPNYPGYGGSGPVFAGWPDLVAQAATVMDLISSLGSFPKADPRRVAVMGHSNGGGVSEILMVADPRVRAVVLFAPVSTDMRDNARKWWVNSRATGALGNPDDPAQKAAYDHISPRNYLEAKDPPALFLQGTLDQDIPAPWTQASYEAIGAAGIRTRLVWFPGAYHDLVGADLDRAVTEAEAWVRQAIG